MKKDAATRKMEKHIDLANKTLVHKIYDAKMKVTEIGVDETAKKSNDFYVYCKLKGKLGSVTETLEYVLENYETKLSSH